MLPYLMRQFFFSFSPAKLIHFPPMLASASQLHANYTGNEMYTQCMFVRFSESVLHSALRTVAIVYYLAGSHLRFLTSVRIMILCILNPWCSPELRNDRHVRIITDSSTFDILVCIPQPRVKDILIALRVYLLFCNCICLRAG